jgi:hypothetical protein
VSLPRPPKGTTGLLTSFGEPWGRPITSAGAAGGIILFPDAFRRDWPIDVDIVLGGVGLGNPAQITKLYATLFRAPNSGRGRIVVSILGTKNFSGNVFYAATANLFPSGPNRPWVANQARVVGDRYTNDGRQYIVYSTTGGGLTAPSGGPTGNGATIGGVDHLVVDNEVTWRCIVNGDTSDGAVPDAQFIAGAGSVVNGITLPEGIIPQLRRAFNVRSFNLRCYSNGEAMGNMLIRLNPGLFRTAILLAGCGPHASDPKYVSSAGGSTSVLKLDPRADVTVNSNGNPPGPSSVAIGLHPSQKASLEDLASGMGQTGSLADTGARLNFTTVTGSETEVHDYPAPITVGGRTVRFRYLASNGSDHNFSVQPDGFKYMTDWPDAVIDP